MVTRAGRRPVGLIMSVGTPRGQWRRVIRRGAASSVRREAPSVSIRVEKTTGRSSEGSAITIAHGRDTVEINRLVSGVA
jgi:hypothetical protein